MPVLFDISGYLKDKYFDIVWGYYDPWEPPQINPSKNQFFEPRNFGCQFFFDISRYLIGKYFDIVWEYHLHGYPPNGPPKIDFLNGST